MRGHPHGTLEREHSDGTDASTVRGVVADRRLDGIERWFVERGLPHFVERRDTATDDLGPGAAAARRRPTSCSASTPSTCRELERSPQNLAAPASSSSASPSSTWVVANRAAPAPLVRPPARASAPPSSPCSSSSPAIPSLVVRPVGRRRADVRRRRSPCSLVLWASPATASSPLLRLGRGSARWPSWPLLFNVRRPGPAAAAAVHDVPVHQRRGAGRWPGR